jgi:hypothetical protein
MQKWFNAPDGLSGFFKAARGMRTIRRMIYKEPFLSFAPDFVDRALPHARVIHIYRDGRDVANSLVRTYDVLTDESLTNLQASEMRLGRRVDHRYVPWWVEDGEEADFLAASPYVRAIWMWKHMVGYCYDYYERPDVKASGRVMLLRYEDLMHRPHEVGMAVLDHLGAPLNPTYKKMLGNAHARSIGSYKKRDAAEVEAAERIAHRELSLYGYR